jgi:hypothetical protein
MGASWTAALSPLRSREARRRNAESTRPEGAAEVPVSAEWRSRRPVELLADARPINRSSRWGRDWSPPRMAVVTFSGVATTNTVPYGYAECFAVERCYAPA